MVVIMRSSMRMMALALAVSLLSLVGCHSVETPSITNACSASGLVYDLIGEGPFVVLIHGTNLDRRMWDGEVVWLQDHARVLRYDLRGQGASADPEASYSNHGDLLELLDELGGDAVTLVGLSAGAQVALDVALQAPRRVRRLVLVSPSLSGYVPEQMPPFFADLSSALRARDYERANEVLLVSSIMSVPSESEDRVREMVTANTRLWTLPFALIEQVAPPAIERLDTIQMPTLILVGEHDLAAVHAQSVLLEQQMVDARRVVIPGGGHLLNMTSPVAFREALSAFLNSSKD